MNACYTYIHWTHLKHVSVERNLGLKGDIVAICDMANGVEVRMTPRMARELAQMMTDLAEEKCQINRRPVLTRFQCGLLI